MSVASRLTVVEQVGYQAEGQDPVGCVTRYLVASAGAEQPFERKWTLDHGGQWVRLPRGDWFDQAALIVLSNLTGTAPLQRIPSKEQKAQEAGRVVEVRFVDPGQTPVAEATSHMLLPPGEGLRLRPADLGGIWLRSRHGPARLHLTTFPRELTVVPTVVKEAGDEA
jgi:hypothetical protein